MIPLTTLTCIRRKVDKATKRADAQQYEFRHGTGSVNKHILGADPLRPDFFVVKGDYSAIFPASVGATVADLVLPRAVARNPEEARAVTGADRPWGMTVQDMQASQALHERLAIHQATLTRLAPRPVRQEALEALAGAI